MDYMAEKATTENYDPSILGDLNNDRAFSYYGMNAWDVILGYNTSLIHGTYDDSDNFTGYTPELKINDKVNQFKYSNQSGYTGEYVISFGSNIANKLYIGASLGIQELSYENNTDYIERGVEGNASHFNNLIYSKYLSVSGKGYNFKTGIIYRPIKDIRIGLAIHTPTYFYLIENYMEAMSSSIGLWNNYNVYSPIDHQYEYRIQTPLRAIASFAYTFGKIGLLSIDYEIINYSGMKMENPEYRNDFVSENEYIKNNMNTASNIRVGAETWISNNYALRAGFIYNESPIKEKEDKRDMSRYVCSAGFGYKYDNFFVDAAYSISITNNYSSLYSGEPNIIKERNYRNKIMMTLGFRF
jgi:hypothetical protein